MDAFKKVYPAEFYKKFLAKDVRPDGRSLSKIRKTSISVGSISSANGSAFVKIGHTSVVAGVIAQVGDPPSADETHIIVNVELSPLCSSRFVIGKPSEQAMVLGESLNSIVKNTGLLNSQDLLFTAEEAGDGRRVNLAWILAVDVYCLNDDGNLFDACLIALLAALSNVRLPLIKSVRVLGSGYGITLPRKSKEFQGIRLLHHPIPTSFAFIDHYTIADPTSSEESLSNGALTIIYNEFGECCSLTKSGISILDNNKLSQCAEKAKKRVKSIIEMMQQSDQDFNKQTKK